MTTLQLGLGAYKRSYGSIPEIKCINRFVEQDAVNQLEHVTLLTRPGTTQLHYYLPNTVNGSIRGLYSQIGLFDEALFAVSGNNIYRTDTDMSTFQISGEVLGSGTPSVDFVAGAGYERMFIADGLLLNYYDGGTHASGTLTDDGSADFTANVMAIGNTYYSWNADVNANSPTGLEGHPFLCLPGSSSAEAMENMSNMINFEGTPGVDFSSTITSASTIVTAASSTATLTVTARSDTESGNAITTTVPTADGHLAWGAATLTGGGNQDLHGVTVPTGEAIKCVAALDSYLFASVANSNKFFYLPPGEITIDALDFATKESAPDPIIDIKRMGDVMVIMGAASTEFWAATGDADNPFAPIEGRTLSRGIIEGTAVAVNESLVILVGNDGIVYKLESGVTRVSDHGIEEHIRIQLRREAGQ